MDRMAESRQLIERRGWTASRIAPGDRIDKPTDCPNFGVREVADHVWLISFMHYDLGFFDDETCRVECAPNPFGAKVSGGLKGSAKHLQLTLAQEVFAMAGRYSTVSGTQRVELWRRYRAGETVRTIAHALAQRATN